MAFGIAVLGLDHWYTAFGVLDNCAASAETPLLSIYEPDAARRAEVAALYPRALVTDSAEAALSVPGVELAAICARTGDAVRLSKQALAAGKHVVSVKPFARTVDEAADVLDTATRAGRFFGSFEGMQRLQPRAELLRDLIASGTIGEVLSFHQVGHGPLPAPWRGAKNGEPSWWIDPEQVPGGAWIDHAIYAVDLARFALDGYLPEAVEGDGDQRILGATLANRVHKQLPVEDFGAVLIALRRRNGGRGGGADVTLNITDTWCAAPGTGYGEYRFIGTEGTLTADGNAWVAQAKIGTTRQEWATGSAYFRFDTLAALLQSGAPVPFGKTDALENLRVCLSVYGR